MALSSDSSPQSISAVRGVRSRQAKVFLMNSWYFPRSRRSFRRMSSKGRAGVRAHEDATVKNPHEQRVSRKSALGLRVRGLHAGCGELVVGPAQESELLGVGGATDEAQGRVEETQER